MHFTDPLCQSQTHPPLPPWPIFLPPGILTVGRAQRFLLYQLPPSSIPIQTVYPSVHREPDRC